MRIPLTLISTSALTLMTVSAVSLAQEVAPASATPGLVTSVDSFNPFFTE